jgi:hypothetical protein
MESGAGFLLDALADVFAPGFELVKFWYIVDWFVDYSLR